MNSEQTNTEAWVEHSLQQAAAVFRPPAALKQRVIQNLPRILATPTPKKRQSVLRWTTRSMAACAAAALIGTLLVLWPGAGNGQNAALAEVALAIENAKSAQWVHVVYMGNRGTSENWLSLPSYRRFSKEGKTIELSDPEANRRYHYDTTAGVLTITKLEEEEDDERPKRIDDSCKLFVERRLEEARESGGTVNKTAGKLWNRTVTLYTVVERGGADLRFAIDAETKRPILFEELDQSGDDDFPAIMTLDYPETGPKDIYELGVPRDAKVVDNTKN